MKITKTVTADLKTHKYHIICSRILLICFIAGQYMVYAHRHSIVKGAGKSFGIAKNIPRHTVSEKCYLCDVMHHNTMVSTTQIYFNPVAAIGHVFKSVEYSFTSIQLILSCGRAPPSSNYFV
ncbi:MAG: hypothetical protein ACHQIM_10205 [Sphingobacteriales bacterium]